MFLMINIKYFSFKIKYATLKTVEQIKEDTNPSYKIKTAINSIIEYHSLKKSFFI